MQVTAYDQVPSISVPQVETISINRMIEDSLIGNFATQLVSYTNQYDQLSNVEVFSYPPLSQLKQDFIDSDLYSKDEVDTIMSAYAKLPKYQNRA